MVLAVKEQKYPVNKQISVLVDSYSETRIMQWTYLRFNNDSFLKYRTKNCYKYTQYLIVVKASRKFKYQRRADSSAAEHCCVPLCSASSKFNSVLSFHSFPTDEERRKKWICDASI